jgi:YVTN family beta-propeller protein
MSNKMIPRRTIAALSSAVLVTVVASIGTASAQPPTIPVGAHPWGVAVNQSTGLVYVTNEASDSVSVINANTRRQVAPPIPVGIDPQGVAVDPKTDMIYVTNFSSDSLSIINGRTRLVRTVPFGKLAIDPDSVAVNAATDTIYVGGYMSSNVLVTNGLGTVTHNIAVPGSNIHDVVVDTATNTAYASAYNLGYVAEINMTSNTVTGQLTGLSGPAGEAVDGSNGFFCVALNWTQGSAPGDRLACYDGGALFSLARFTGDPNFVAILGSEGLALSSLPNSNQVAISNVNTGSVGSYVTVGSSPEGLDVDTSNDMVFVANYGSNSVSAFRA